MRVNIDFSGRSPWPLKSSVLLFLIGLGACAGASWEGYEAYREQLAAARKLAAARPQGRREAVRLSAKQVEAVNRAVRQLNLPWQELLGAIEEQLSDRVALLSVEPDAASRTLHIQGEVKTADDMVDFVEALNDDERFVSATLVRHEVNDADQNRPYRFVLEAEWSGDL